MAGSALSPLRIGPIEIRVDADEVKAFSRAISIGKDEASDHVPATFPISWLSHPALAGIFQQAKPDGHVVPVLEAQRFAYDGRLAIGDACLFEVERSMKKGDPSRFVVTAAVRTSGGLVVEFTATYHFAPLTGPA